MTWHEQEQAFQRLYGPWAPLDIQGARALMAGFDAPWWVVGGYAVEAFTGVVRHHEDIDITIFRRDLDRLRALVDGRLHVWSAGGGAIRPVNDDWPEPHGDAGQVWLREHALAPWVADVILQDVVDGRWVSRRNPEHVATLEEVTWVAADGVRYIAPEIALEHKARLRRPKDDADLDAAWPLLSTRQRRFVHDGARREDPPHPWLERLDEGSEPGTP